MAYVPSHLWATYMPKHGLYLGTLRISYVRRHLGATYGGLLKGYLGAPYGGTIEGKFRGSLSSVLEVTYGAI